MILHFQRLCPETGSGAGKKRGEFDWTHQYRHSYRVENASEDVEAVSKLDYVAFVALMERVRKWTAKESEERWAQLKNNPAIERDFGGIDGCLRLWVPASWTGGGQVLKRRSNIESKELEES